MEKTFHYVVDWYVNKNLVLTSYTGMPELKIGDKVVYSVDEAKGQKKSIGTYVGTGLHDVDKEAVFIEILKGSNLTEFEEKQKKASSYFPIFKTKFKKNFPVAVPVTVRYHIFSKQYYFYFYADERFNFTDFLKEFRQDIGQNFFLFQVGARDMVKMSPGTDHIIGCNGKNLCCKSNRPLPSINVEAILAQHLDGRDVERLKGRCGKLKCSLLYEFELYLSENSKYPEKGTTVEDSGCEQCGVVLNYNIMNGLIIVRDNDGKIFELALEDLKKTHKLNKQ